MTHIEKLDTLLVFPSELKGDTLVVSPKGDAVGFSPTMFQKERERILLLLAEPHIKNLIIDFGSTNYFGSEMIGAVNQLVIKAQDEGGQTGVCNVSPDMQEGLHIMRLDSVWTMFDTRKEALKAIANEPISQKIEAQQNNLLILAVIVIVAASLLGMLVLRTPDPQKASYNEMMAVWEQLQDLRSQNVNTNRWKLFKKSSLRTLSVNGPIDKEQEKIDAELKKQIAPARKSLLQGRKTLLSILVDPRQKNSALETLFTKSMTAAYEDFGWDPKAKSDTPKKDE